jgi:archaellum component FlaG (FlaF/FlaG flagellin family)
MKGLLLAATILAAFLSFGQTNITVQIQDTSGDGSPMANVGSCLISETIENSKTVDSIQYELKIKNTSEKPIMMFVENLVVWFPSGHGQTFSKQKDTFFGRNPFGPGDILDMGYQTPNKMVHENASDRSVEPYCKVRVMYVQFTDGSHFGGIESAEHILDLRQQIWNRLGSLQVTYIKQGEKAFLDELQKPVEPAEVNSFLDMFRQYQGWYGTQKLVEFIGRHLQESEERANQLLAHRE